LKKPRYINQSIENELADFKQEIAEKHAKSEINKTYVFQRSEIYLYSSATNNNNSLLGTTDRMTSGNVSSGAAGTAQQNLHKNVAGKQASKMTGAL